MDAVDGWRAHGDRFGAVAERIWAWRGLIVLLASSLSAVAAYRSIWGLADELDVAVADFSFDRSAYVLFVGTYVALGLLWVSLIGVVAAITFVALDELRSRRATSTATFFFGVAMVLLWVYGRDGSGILGLILVVLLFSASGAFVGAAAAWPDEDMKPVRWSAVGSVAVLPAMFVVVAFNGFSSEGRDVADYARSLARGEVVAEPSSLLGLSVAPSRGWLTIAGERFCVVRLSDRVHLLVPGEPEDKIETLIAPGESFVSERDC